MIDFDIEQYPDAIYFTSELRFVLKNGKKTRQIYNDAGSGWVDCRSNRKPHNTNAGYIAEKQYNGAHIVIYNADEAGLDVGKKYAIVCETHNRLVGATSVPNARLIMKTPDFCEKCMPEATE